MSKAHTQCSLSPPLNVLMLSRHLLYIFAESLFFFAQSISKLLVCESSIDWAFPVIQQLRKSFPIEARCILCLKTLLWACFSRYFFVPKEVMLDCYIEVPVDRLSPKAETIPFEKKHYICSVLR